MIMGLTTNGGWKVDPAEFHAPARLFRAGILPAFDQLYYSKHDKEVCHSFVEVTDDGEVVRDELENAKGRVQDVN